MSPRVTVLMPVYNAAQHLFEAVSSILTGTYQDFELLAIDDGSTDGSEGVLRRIGDARLRIVRNDANLGVIDTLNRGLDLAEGELLARMDADDVSMPDRLARQVDFMDANPQIGLVGTWAKTIGAGAGRSIRTPVSSAEIHVHLFAFNALCHPTVMMRRRLFAAHGLRYSREAPHAEDLDLWMRASDCFGLSNLPVVALHYRMHASQVSSRFAAQQHETLTNLRVRQLRLLVPSGVSRAEIEVHLKAFDPSAELTHSDLVAIGHWLCRLEDFNARSRRYEPLAFRSLLAQRWLNASHRCSPRTLQVWRIWRNSPFATSGLAAHLWLLGKMVLNP